VYTELALSAADRLIIPFTADGSSKRAVRSVLALVYGVTRTAGNQQSQYFLNSNTFRMTTPLIYTYVGNRLTQNLGPASAFRTVVSEIGNEIFAVWRQHPNRFAVHPGGAPMPRTQSEFRRMFQVEINDANTPSVVSGTLGLPMHKLAAGPRDFLGKRVMVNQTQLNSLIPNIRAFAQTVE